MAAPRLTLDMALINAPRRCAYGILGCKCNRCDWTSPQHFNEKTQRYELCHSALPPLNIFIQRNEVVCYANLLAYLFHHLPADATQSDCDALIVRYKEEEPRPWPQNSLAP
jgi:hypothetical protein